MPTQRTVNQILTDRAIRHTVYLVRLSGGEARWVNEQIPSLRRAIREAIAPSLAGIDPSQPSLTDHTLLDEASQKAAEATMAFFDRIRSGYMERLREIAMLELEYEHRLFQQAIPIEMEFDVPSDLYVHSLLQTEPLSGKTINQWFHDLEVSTRAAINEQIREGMLEGESVAGIIERVQGTAGRGYTDGVIGNQARHVEAIVRTGVMSASNIARQAFHDANADVIKSYSVVTTLDSRTCLQCAYMESQNPYRKDEPPVAPFHIQCRCVVVANTLSWEELGIDLEEMTPGTRASMDGEVPADMTYQQWFDQQSSKLQKEILGPSRYAAYKKGMEVTAFTDRGQILTLEELRLMEPDLFPN